MMDVGLAPWGLGMNTINEAALLNECTIWSQEMIVVCLEYR